MKAVDRFLDDLAEFSSARVFNPWGVPDPVNDRDGDAPAIRRENLRRYLVERVGRARIVLVAEAAGYQGCKFSGIAMTSERQLMGAPRDCEFFEGAKRRTSRESVRPAGFTEPTATIVWGKMLQAGLRGRDWVNWNTFAWHPAAGHALSNRTPTPAELEAGLPALERFLALFPEATIVPVGRKAEETLRELEVPAAAAVRHPANGGATAFGQGIDAILARREPVIR